MAKNISGQLTVAEIEGGQWIALATSAPFFCFRAESEDAVVAKVRAALTFSQSRTRRGATVKVTPVSQTLTSIRDGKRYDINKLLEAA